MKKSIVLSALIVSSLTSWAWGGFCGPDRKVTWDLTDDGTLTIKGNGTMYQYSTNDKKAPWKDLGVKTVTIEEGVQNIGEYAFNDCYNLISISIPGSVTTIGKSAFYRCNSLVSITISSSVTSIGSEAFSGCTVLSTLKVEDGNPVYDSRDDCNAIIKSETNELVFGCGSTIIPNSVTSIGEKAFYYCTGLKSLEIPNSITNIGNEAFSNCQYLTSITIPNSVTSIGDDAFWYCTSLTSITSSSSMTHVGSNAFSHTPWLDNQPEGLIYIGKVAYLYKGTIPDNTSIEIKEGTVELARNLFQDCSGLISIKIPNSVTSIGQSVFSGCSGLATIDLPSNLESISNSLFSGCTSLTRVTIPDGITSVGIYAFSGCSSLETVNLTNSVKSIAGGAFHGCRSLKYITIPEGVTIIEWSVFHDCTGLTSVSIPQSVTSISECAFQGCTSFASIDIPDNVTEIGPLAFADCTRLSSATLRDNIEKIGFDAFKNTPWYENYKGLLYIGKVAYKYQGDIPDNTKIEIREGTLEISNNAFEGCSGLISITIPSSLTNIGQNAFSGCSNLSSVIFHCPKIDSWFSGNTAIKEVVIGDEVKEIVQNAFANCSGLTSASIGSSVTLINFGTFKDCSSLTSVSIAGSVNTIYADVFNGCTQVTTVKFRHSKEELNNLIWSVGTDKLKGPSGTTLSFSDDVKSKVGRSYFRYRTDELANWMIENPECFDGIDKEGYTEGNFVKMTVDNDPIWLPVRGSLDGNNYSISGLGSFAGYKAIRASLLDGSKEGSLDLSKVATHSDGTGDKYQITSIGFEAFRGMPITGVTLPETLKELGGSSLRETSLRKVVIPNSLTSIGGPINKSSDQFRGCSKLNTVVLGKNIESIGPVVFSKCESLEIVVSLSMTPPTLDETSFIYWGAYPETTFKNHSYGIIVHNDVLEEYQNAEYWKDLKYFQSYETTPIYVKVDTLSRKGSSVKLHFYPVDAAHNYGDIPNGEEYVINGLVPEASMSGVKINWKTKDGNYGTAILDIQTSAFTIETNEGKALSTTKARLMASVDEYDDMTHYGFEWRRIDAPDLIASSKVSAPLYNGQIIGTLNNLNPDVYYKYRPFYTSDSGETYYGEWVGLFTGDANVYFEPEVYTKDAEDITKVSALLAGVWFEGTDDIQEKGFEYWTVSNAMTRAVGNDVKKVAVSGSGNAMTATLEGLKAGATYGYRSYAKTASGTTYGEEKTFKTILIGDVNGDGEVTEADTKAVADHIIGNTPAGFNKKMADVNEDGKINAADIVLIVNMISSK